MDLKQPLFPQSIYFHYIPYSLCFVQAICTLKQVGLAVGDTEKMKKLATIKRLQLQIEYHIEIEKSYPAFITQVFYKDVYIEKPNKHPIYDR